MKQFKTVTKVLTITAAGAQNFFTMPLPADATHIVGVQASITSLTVGGLNIRKGGTLRLRMAGIAGDFYCAEIEHKAGAQELAILGFGPTLANAQWRNWYNLPFVSGCKRQMERIAVKNSEALNGWYSDELARQFNHGLTYTVTIAIWVEVN